MKQSTKQRIIKTSQKLFFEYGIANTRLQQIADGVNISVGNLAYHFENKEAIVEAAYEEVFSQLTGSLHKPLKQKDLSDFNKFFEALFQFVNAYPFCFNNVWEIARNHPGIQKKWESFSNKLLGQTLSFIEFNIKRGVLGKETYKGYYNLVAQQFNITFLFWQPNQMLKGKRVTETLFKRALWNLLCPNLTSKGLKEYQKLINPF